MRDAIHLSRRSFTTGLCLAATAALHARTTTAAPVADAWPLANTLISGYRAGDRAAPLLIVVHGLNGLDQTTRTLCRHLAEFNFHVLAPDLFGQRAVPLQRESLHRLSDTELARLLDATVALAHSEAANTHSPTFLAVNATATNFTKSRDTRFSHITTYLMPRAQNRNPRTLASTSARAWAELGNWLRR